MAPPIASATPIRVPRAPEGKGLPLDDRLPSGSPSATPFGFAPFPCLAPSGTKVSPLDCSGSKYLAVGGSAVVDGRK